LAGHLANHPFDFTVITPIMKASKAIGDCAQALRNGELRALSQQLASVSQNNLSLPEEAAELATIMLKIVAIAEIFGDLESPSQWAGMDKTSQESSDPFGSMDGTRWVVL